MRRAVWLLAIAVEAGAAVGAGSGVGAGGAIEANSAAAGGQKVAPEGVVRADRTSPFGRVVVTDYPSSGLRCLEFPPGRVLQSCMDLVAPNRLVLGYTRTMLAALALRPAASRVLVLGLGGGSLTRVLQHYFPRITQDAVDLDPAVVALARESFGVREGPNTRLVVADARAFLAASRTRYDIILVDAFGPDEAPFHLTTHEFFTLVRTRLRPGGVVAVNLWGPPANPEYRAQRATIASVFPHSSVLVTGGAAPFEGLRTAAQSGTAPGLGAATTELDLAVTTNRIVFGALRPLPDREAWAAQAATLVREHGLDFDLAALVRE